MRLATRIIMLVFAITLLMGILSIILSGPIIKQGFKGQDEEWREALALSLSEGIAHDVINGNAAHIRKILETFVLKKNEFDYAYVEDFDQHIFAHTFKDGFPAKLIELIRTHQEHDLSDIHSSQIHIHSEKLQLDGEDVEDISYHIIEGMSAKLHLGINQKTSEALVRAVNQKLVMIIIALGLFGFLLAFFLSRRLTRPLEQFGRLMQDYGNNKLKDKVEIPRGSLEINKLVDVFNQMIKSRSRAEVALHEVSELNERIISESPIGLSIYNHTGQCIAANKSVAEMVGATQEQVLTQNYKNIESWKRSGILDTANKCMRLQEKERHGFDVVTSIGKHAFYDCLFVPFKLHGKQHLLLMLDDITERRQFEEKITSLAHILEDSLNEIYIFDAKTLRFIRVNKGARLNLGYSMEELDCMTPLDFKQGFTSESFEKMLEPLRADKKEKIQFTAVHRRKDGSLYDVDVHLQLSTFQSIPVFVAIILDVTERKRVEVALQNSTERYRSLIEATTSIIWTTDGSGEFVVPQPSWEKYTGQPWSEHKGFGWTKKIHPDDIEHILKTWKKAIREISFYATWGRIWNANLKEWRDFEVRAVPIMNQDRSLREWIGIITDITERKQVERELKELNESLEYRVMERNAEVVKLSHAVEQSSSTVVITDVNGKIEYVNPRFMQTTGYTPEEAIGKNPSVLKSGKTKPEVYRELWRTISSGNEWRGEFHNKKKNGELYWELASISPIRNEEGDITNFIAVKEDITERKQVESRLKAAMEESHRANIAKSVFLSSMSHELRTPMNSMLGFAQLLDLDTIKPLSVSQKEYVTHILKSGNHLLELINEVLDLSGIESGKIQISLEDIEINTAINEIIATVEPLAEENKITINCQTKRDGQFIRADNTRLNQVLINLLSNAIKYNNDGGSVSIWIESPTDKILRINIEDTGPGIAKEKHGSLFEPFNRLGAESLAIEGTGIGLTITKRLVEIMGGSIGVESEVGKGAKFYVDFKKAENPVMITCGTERGVAEKNNASIIKRYTMLYVEDNPANLKLAESILQRRPGINLLTAPQAQLGIELARSHQPDIILMDINLPGMDGYEALKLLKSNNQTKEIPVIALSANAMPKDIERGKASGFREYITKPINVNRFLEVIDNILMERAR